MNDYFVQYMKHPFSLLYPMLHIWTSFLSLCASSTLQSSKCKLLQASADVAERHQALLTG